MSLEADYLGAFEEHSADDIRAALAAGASPTALIKGKTPIASLIEGYLRSPRFADCLRVLIDAGASVGDPLLEAVLLDDVVGLAKVLRDEGPTALSRRLSVPCAFTSCDGVTALHVCAEFNSVNCTRLLLDSGASVDAPAEFDADGFGGQTPLFHTVNNIYNYGQPMMELLVDAGASIDMRLKGLVWGRGAEWQTLILDVTPISYAQCGLYPQFHRRESDVYGNLAYLYERRYGTPLPIDNFPNRYLARG
jgi:ankyrin repeat protein